MDTISPSSYSLINFLGDGSDMGPIMRRPGSAPQSNPKRNTIQLKDKLTATSVYSSRESDAVQEVLKFLALRVPG